MRNVARVFVFFNILTAILVYIFMYWNEYTIVKVLGITFILSGILGVCQSARAHGLNRIAFGSRSGLIPNKKERELFSYFRKYAEIGEDAIAIFVLNYTFVLIIMSSIVESWLLCIVGLYCGFLAVYAVRRTWPGFVLYLGASGSDIARRTLKNIAFSVQPLNVTHLFNFIDAEEVQETLFIFTSCRLKNPTVSWQSAVEVHAALARLVVIDTRVATDHIITELTLIDQHDFWHKTILITNNHEYYMQLAHKAGFDRQSIEKMSNNCAIVTHEKDAGGIIKLVKLNLPRVPTIQNPIAVHQD